METGRLFVYRSFSLIIFKFFHFYTACLSRLLFTVLDNSIDLTEMIAIALYEASMPGECRPIQDQARMQAMLQQVNPVITAWAGTQWVSISRAFSDFAFVTYLSYWAFHRDCQKQGFGKEFIW